MTLAIDAILIFTAVFCVWAGARKGFVRSVMGFISTVVSAIAAYAFTPALSAWVEERFLRERITDGIAESLRQLSLDTTTDLFNLDRLISDPPKFFNDLIARYHVDLSSLKDLMTGIDRAGEESVRSLSERIAAPTSSAIASAASFAVIFLGAFLVMTLFTALLDLIFRLPVLNGANMFFGFLVGVAEAAVFVSVLALVLSVLVRALGAFDPTLFGDEAVNNTILCSFLEKHNIFTFLSAVLK
ncbi:MAG: CvpA family protein [Clostridia bacterium]|nr:CvpA family protein [Clostridia bacterium]